MPEMTPAELKLGNDLLDAVRAEAVGDVLGAAMLSIPHFKEDPIGAGAMLLSWLRMAIGTLSSHTGMTPTAVGDMIWSKPGDRRG